MTDVESWVASEGERLLFVYGETDPWTAGRYPLPATDSLSLTAPDSNHGSNLTTLAPADRDAALAKLEAWTGVTPNVRAVTDQPARPRPRLIPSAFLRAH